MSSREAWMAVVERDGEQPESELVTIERTADGAPPVIVLTDGTRISCTEPAGERQTRAA